MDLQTLTAEFLASKAGSGRSPRTIYSYQWNLESFATWCDGEGYAGNDLVGPVGAETIEEHMIYMANCDYRPHTISQRYRALRALYRWTERRHGRLEAGNPFDILTEPTTPDLLPKAATYAQLQVLLYSIKVSPYGAPWTCPRDKLIIKMFFFTGVRLSEMASLRIEDVDLERRRLRVQRHKTKGIDLVPFSRTLQADLSAWLMGDRPAAGHDGLWPASTGDRRIAPASLSAHGISQMCRYRCEQAGLPVLMPHAFRHGCAVHIIERGGDISLVKRILGHKDIRTSQVYLRFDTDQVTGLYDRIFE